MNKISRKILLKIILVLIGFPVAVYIAYVNYVTISGLAPTDPIINAILISIAVAPLVSYVLCVGSWIISCIASRKPEKASKK